MFCSFVSYGQNISVTFTGTGAATQIDTVTAINQQTNQRVIFPGNETLLLTVNTGITSVSAITHAGMVFPNPFSGSATFTAVIGPWTTATMECTGTNSAVVMVFRYGA